MKSLFSINFANQNPAFLRFLHGFLIKSLLFHKSSGEGGMTTTHTTYKLHSVHIHGCSCHWRVYIQQINSGLSWNRCFLSWKSLFDNICLLTCHCLSNLFPALLPCVFFYTARAVLNTASKKIRAFWHRWNWGGRCQIYPAVSHKWESIRVPYISQ